MPSLRGSLVWSAAAAAAAASVCTLILMLRLPDLLPAVEELFEADDEDLAKDAGVSGSALFDFSNILLILGTIKLRTCLLGKRLGIESVLGAELSTANTS